MDSKSDQIAFKSLLKVRPAWTGIRRASDVLELVERSVLHAGPPFSLENEIPAPIANSAAVAIVYEGWAKNLTEATELIQTGKIQFFPAQDKRAVTPMAAVITPSMNLIEISDLNDEASKVWTPINGGGTGGDPVPRYGKKSEAALSFVRHLNGEIASGLETIFQQPLGWYPIMDEALTKGDDGHLCHNAAHSILIKKFSSSPNYWNISAAVREFFEKWPFIHLNFWMACSKLALMSTEGFHKSSLVTHMGGNGSNFGIKVAGLPNRWFCSQASQPMGNIREPFTIETTLGALGDSAISEAFGTGAMALSFSEKMRELHQGFYAQEDLSLSELLLMGSHPQFGHSHLTVGLSANKVTSTRSLPIIELGCIDKHGENGGLGAGIFKPPLEIFENAVKALDNG